MEWFSVQESWLIPETIQNTFLGSVMIIMTSQASPLLASDTSGLTISGLALHISDSFTVNLRYKWHLDQAISTLISDFPYCKNWVNFHFMSSISSSTSIKHVEWLFSEDSSHWILSVNSLLAWFVVESCGGLPTRGQKSTISKWTCTALACLHTWADSPIKDSWKKFQFKKQIQATGAYQISLWTIFF